MIMLLLNVFLLLTSVLYTKIPHKLLLEVLCDIIDFVFKGCVTNIIVFYKNSLYLTTKGVDKHIFTK